jgi:hypothetical protein
MDNLTIPPGYRLLDGAPSAHIDDIDDLPVGTIIMLTDYTDAWYLDPARPGKVAWTLPPGSVLERVMTWREGGQSGDGWLPPGTADDDCPRCHPTHKLNQTRRGVDGMTCTTCINTLNPDYVILTAVPMPPSDIRDQLIAEGRKRYTADSWAVMVDLVVNGWEYEDVLTRLKDEDRSICRDLCMMIDTEQLDDETIQGWIDDFWQARGEATPRPWNVEAVREVAGSLAGEPLRDFPAHGGTALIINAIHDEYVTELYDLVTMAIERSEDQNG